MSGLVLAAGGIHVPGLRTLLGELSRPRVPLEPVAKRSLACSDHFDSPGNRATASGWWRRARQKRLNSRDSWLIAAGGPAGCSPERMEDWEARAEWGRFRYGFSIYGDFWGKVAMRRLILSLLVFGTLVSSSAGAIGAGVSQPQSPNFAAALSHFDSEEVAQLVAGESVRRKFRIRRGNIDYHAGLGYRLIQTSPMEVIRALRRPDGIVRAIPYGVEATTVSENDGVARVRIRQGKSPIIGKYSVRLEWDLGSYQARFWVDPTEERDVRDLWGVFSAREVAPGWTLVSFGFAFNIGGVGELLESKAQRWALDTPDRIAELVVPGAR